MIGREYQSHDRYEENFVTVVEYIFPERHVSSSSIGGGRILCSSCKKSPGAISLSQQIFFDTSNVAVNETTVKRTRHLAVLI